MPNEVEITITADDLSGPAFASALAKMQALKRAAGDIKTGDVGSGINAALLQMERLRSEMDKMSFGRIDTNEISSSLVSMKSKIQALGIADIADVNIPPGRVITQLQFLKRMVQQSGISDLLDINANSAELGKQLQKIGSMTETIPVNFDVGKLPHIAVTGLHVPINFDTAKIPIAGDVAAIDAVIAAEDRLLKTMQEVARAGIGSNLNGKFDIGLSAATIAQMDKMVGETYKLSAGLANLDIDFAAFMGYMQAARDRAVVFGQAMVDNAAYGVSYLRYSAEQLGKELYDGIGTPLSYVGWQLTKFGQDISAGAGFYLSYLASRASSAGSSLATFGKTVYNDVAFKVAYMASKMGDAGRAVVDWGRLAVIWGESTAIRLSTAFMKSYNAFAMTGAAFKTQLPLWVSGGGAWGALTGKFQLFAGVLTHLGLPAFLATAGGVHILIDAAFELISVLIPAGAAFIAFGAAAVPTVQAIVKQMQAAYTTSQAFKTSVYPLTGAFQQVADAVKPNVLLLFGEALVVVNKKTNEFQTLATGAAGVVDQLGARIATALVSGGFSAFMKNGVQDLSQIGNIVGNIFGTVGNLLKVMPGYANIMLGALSGLTHGLEMLTANPVVQWIAGIGLGVHGFLIWAGLGATAAVFLSNALFGLGKTLGLTSASFLAFNAAQFGAGLKLMAAAAWDAVVALFTMSGAEDVAAASGKGLAGAMIAIDAVNPVIWIGAAIGGLAVLVWWLTRSSSATQNYDNAVKNALNNMPVNQLGIGLVQQQANTINQLNQAQNQLNRTTQFTTVQQGKFGGQVRITTGAYNQQLGVVQGYKGELQTLSQYQSNYNYLLKVAHGNTALFTQANITSGDILNASKSQLAQYAIEILAAADANRAMALGVGRNAAAMNAQTNDFMQNILPSLQKVTQAEDAIINVMLGGQQALNTFEQGIGTLAQNFQQATGTGGTVAETLGRLRGQANLAGAALGGTSQASYALNQAFYTEVQNGQKLIDALQQQGISTGDLQKVIATTAGQMAGFAGNNVEARSVIVALINNALGPGTVSLKTLDKWIGNNATSLGGMNAIIAKSTIQAGNFAGVLQTQLIPMMAQASIQALGGQKSMVDFATGVLNGNNAATLWTKDGAAKVVHMFEVMSGGSIPKAKAAFESWATNTLGITNKAATDLANALFAKTNPAVAAAGEAARIASQKIENTFIKSLQQIGFDSPRINNDIINFSNNVLTMGDSSSRTQNARNRLIRDLEAAGLNAQTAQSFVRDLQGQIDAMHGKRVPVTVVGSGSGQITFAEQNIKNAQTGLLEFHAAGGPIRGRGGPKSDQVPVWASNGEYMMQADAVRKYGLGFMEAINSKKFANGGLVNLWGAPNWMSDQLSYAATMSEGDAATKMVADMKAKIAAQIPSGNFVPGSSGYGGSVLAEQQFAASLFPSYGWSVPYAMPDLISLWNQESGWNPYAVNASSGAYGIPQALPSAWGHPYALGDYMNQIRWGMDYIKTLSRSNNGGPYGDPVAAWGHEQAFNWYDNGGWLKPGVNIMMNGTGGWEHLSRDSGPGDLTLSVEGGQSAFEKFMAEWMREFVRLKGGGSVQRAFGSRGKTS